MKKDKIFNIPASCSFVDILAELFIKEYEGRELELVDVLFLLPNRRACNSLREAFVRVKGFEPTMLPQIYPIGNVEEDSLFFSNIQSLEEVSPAIDALERTLLFTKEISQKSKSFGVEEMSISQACSLAKELGGLIDTANYEGLSFDNLKNLVPEEYASHWLETLDFLEIITKSWPDILREKSLVDPSKRYNQMLVAQSKIWQENKTNRRIVVAGTVASFSAITDLVGTVLSLPNGEFYINGLDKYLDESSWEKVDEVHPEYEIKSILDNIGVFRKDIKDIIPSKNLDREILISEVMRPAKTTDKWLDIKNKSLSHMAWQNISVVETNDLRTEALSIAILMRQALETPMKTAALVTTDRNLARRVASELERWDIKVDDSAGKPLFLTALGMFLRLIPKVVETNFDIVDVLSLCKHPFMAMGRNYADFKKEAREFELLYRKDKSIQSDFMKSFKEKYEILFALMKMDRANFKELLKAHIELATSFATTDEIDGNQILWRGEEGKSASSFLANLYEKADILGSIPRGEYLKSLEALMRDVNVRASYGTHPRLKILGPIEARLVCFDRVIIGGANEGVWPKISSADPWMSRPMKKDFGMELPEKNIGVMAKDFASILASEEVYITRAGRVDGTPMVKSRWLMRLETVLAALDVKKEDIYQNLYKVAAEKFDEALVSKRIEAPSPKPPVSFRPRQLSMSGVSSLMLDPYIVFARYILRLKPMDNLEDDLLAMDYGNIIHGILESFNKKYPSSYPDNAKEELLSMGLEFFNRDKIVLETRAFWWPKFEKTVDWLVATENKYRQVVKRVHNEIEGRIEIDAPAGKFVITAKADRIDETIDGKINIIDYKTGNASSEKTVRAGYAPQLPIEGLIARAGGYDGIISREVSSLLYWKLSEKQIVISKDIDDLLDSNLENITKLISSFDFETTAYISKPNYKYYSANRDYEHLARVLEWSVGGDSDE